MENSDKSVTPDIESRLDELERRIDHHENCTDGENRSSAESDGDQSDSGLGPGATRRGVLTAGGILAALGLGAGTASGDPQGRIGTDTDPLETLYTEAIDGGVTGGTELTSLVGSGLTIDAGALEAVDTSKWTDSDDNDLLEPSGSATGIEVTDVHADTLTDNGTGQVSMGNAFDLASNDLVDGGTTIWDAASGHIPQGLLETASLTVAGNSVSLGGSTGIAHGDLTTVTADQHHAKDHDHTETDIAAVPNAGLANDTVTVAGNTASLGGATGVDHADLGAVGASDHHTRPSAGDGLTDASDTFTVSVSDFAGTYLSDDGSDNLTVDIGNGLENDGSGNVQAALGNALGFDGSNRMEVSSGSVGTDELDTDFPDLATLFGTPITTGGNLDLGGNKLTNTASINGTITGNTELTDLVGSGLTINSNTLEVTGSVLWTDTGDDGLLNPADAGDDGIGVTNVQTDTLTDNGSGDVTMGTTLDLAGNDLVDSGTTIWDSAGGHVEQSALENESLTVAGNSVSLGGSTGVDHADLSGVGTDDHHSKDHDHTEAGISTVPNSGLTNSSLTVAGNPVSLGGSTTINHSDLSSIGSSDHHTRPSAGSGLSESSTNFNINTGTLLSIDGSNNLQVEEASISHDNIDQTTVNSGDHHTRPSAGDGLTESSNTFDINPNDFAGSALEEDGNNNLQVSSGGIGTTELNTPFTNLATLVGTPVSTGGDLEVDGSNSILDASGNLHLTVNDGGPLGVGQTLDMNGNDLLVEGNTQVSADTDVTVRIDNNDSATGSDEFRVLGNGGNRKFDVDNNGDAKVYNNLTVSNDLTINNVSNFNSHVYTNGNKLDLGGGRFLNLRHEDNVSNNMWKGELAVDTSSNDLVFITSGSTTYTWNADVSSSVRYKENIEPWSADPYGALELEAKEYDLLDGPYGGDGPTQIGEYGFLAEAADECAPWVVQYVEITEENKDGLSADDEQVGEYVPDRIDYDKFTIAHNEILGDHDEELDDLQAELERKDDRIDQLEDEAESLREETDRLRERNAELESRLDRIEAELGIDATADQQGVADD